jgi:hypothetical protein
VSTLAERTQGRTFGGEPCVVLTPAERDALVELMTAAAVVDQSLKPGHQMRSRVHAALARCKELGLL